MFSRSNHSTALCVSPSISYTAPICKQGLQRQHMPNREHVDVTHLLNPVAFYVTQFKPQFTTDVAKSRCWILDVHTA